MNDASPATNTDRLSRDLNPDSRSDCKRSSDASSGLGQDSYSSATPESNSMSSLDSLHDETEIRSGSEANRAQNFSQSIRAVQSGTEPNRVFESAAEPSKSLQSSLDPSKALRSGSERTTMLQSEENNLMSVTANPGCIQFIDDDVTSGDHVVISKISVDDVDLKSEVGDRNNNAHVEDVDARVVEEAAVGVKFMDEDGDSICSSYSDDEDHESEGGERKGKAPDGGWGWVIVVASFFISTIADGISFSFGLLYVEFLKYFSASSWQTSLIGSLFMSIPLLTGPLGSALVDRYGCRRCTIVGGFVAGLGFMLSAFQSSLSMMYLTFGLVAGVGLGLCYVTAVVSIAYWFDRRRTLATGLGACGTGVGTVVFAPITSYCLTEYGWRGTILLLAGAMFNMCVCGALMRGPQWWADKAASLAGTKSLRESCGSVSALLDLPELKRMLQSGETLTTAALIDETEQYNLFHSAVALPTYVTQSDKFSELVGHYPGLLACRSLSDGSKVNIGTPVRAPARPAITQDTMESPQSPDTPLLLASHPQLASQALLDDQLASIPLLDDQHTSLRPAIKKTAHKQQHYLRNIRVHRNSVMYRGAMLNTHRYRLRASSCPNIYRNSMTTIALENQEKWYADMLELLCGMFRDFSMFRELHFLLMSVATILLFTWFIVPYFYLADHAQLNEYDDEQVASLFMIIGVTNFIGMVFLGWAGDQEWMHVTKTYAGCLVACGVSTLAMPLCTRHYPLLCGACALFGLFSASSFPFTPVILVQLIPLERFTTAYGLSLMCQGIGSLVGPPLAGWLYDLTRNYHLSFHMAGAWIIVAGLLVAVIPATENRTLWGAGTLEKSPDITVIAV